MIELRKKSSLSTATSKVAKSNTSVLAATAGKLYSWTITMSMSVKFFLS
jgi:hypothetical protein